MHVSDCSTEFEKATNCKLDDLFVNAEEELPEFFKLKSDIFSLSPNGEVTLVNPQSYDSMAKLQKQPRTQSTSSSAKNNSSELIVLD